MKLKSFMIVNAITSVIVGILLVLIPTAFVSFFGLSPDRGMDLDGQLYGSELILMGLVCWFARDISEPKTQRGLLSAFFIANLISLVLAVIGEVNHTFNTVGWIAVAAYLLLTVVYGIYWLVQPRQVSETRQISQPSLVPRHKTL